MTGHRFTWDDAAATLTVEGSPVAREVAVRLVGVHADVAGAWSPGNQPLTWAATSLNGEAGYARITIGERPGNIAVEVGALHSAK